MRRFVKTLIAIGGAFDGVTFVPKAVAHGHL
jgi:hypothetical protein